MYPVREVSFLVVLAGPEVLNENIGKCPDLARREVARRGARRRGRPPAADNRWERDAFSRYAGVGPIDRNAVEAFNFREIRSNIA
jgi:hypothetical protein